MTEFDREMYVILGIAAGAFFLVAAMRAFSLRRYESIFDGDAPQGSATGVITGRYSGRGAEIVHVSADHTMSKPAELRISLTCAAPLEVEAVRESMATAFRKVVGVQPDRKSGLEDLDRLFAFQFYDRRKVEDCLGRIECRESFVALADLGARSVRLRDSLLTVEVPIPFIVPPGVGRIRDIFATMLTLGVSMESALAGTSGSALTSTSTSDLLSHESRPSGASIEGPAFAAVCFVAMIIAFLIVGSFWDFNGRVPWRTRMVIVHARLPIVAALAGFSGFMAGFLIPRRPMLWGFCLSWPLILHAVLAWILYLVMRGTGIPELQKEIADQAGFVRAALTAATTAAAVALGSGFLGAILGGRVSGNADHSKLVLE